jgi:ferredoxin
MRAAAVDANSGVKDDRAPSENPPMQIQILRNECCGNGQCVEIAPDVFARDPRGKAYVLDADAAPTETLIEAAEACPCQAIVVKDNEGDVVFP